MKIPKVWTFKDKEIANNFDEHVREQLPWYDFATSSITHIARHYVQQDGNVYDLGASTGNIGNSIKSILKERNCSFTAIDNSAEMVSAYTCEYGDIIHHNIEDYKYKNFDFCTLFLTLMFVSPKAREELLDEFYNKCTVGGAIVIFDKEVNTDGYFGIVNYRLNLLEKVKSRTNYKDIIDKELSLSGIQRPLDKKTLQKYNAKLFFKFSNFVGYIIEK